MPTITLKEAEDLAKKMATPQTFTAVPEPEPKPSNVSSLLQKIPFFQSLFIQINDTAEATAGALQKAGDTTPAINDVANQLPVVGLALSSLDFVRIPMIYIAAYFLNETVPFTLSNGARWAYSGVLLGLGLASIFVPFVGPILAVTAAVFMLTVSVITLKMVWDARNKGKDELQTLSTELATAESDLHTIENEASQYASQLADPAIDTKISIGGIEALKPNYDAKVAEIQEMYNKQDTLNKNLTTDMDLIDQGFYTNIYLLFATGAVLSLMSVPAAPIVFISAGLAEGTYLLGRMTAPLFSKFRDWMLGADDQKTTTISAAPAVNSTNTATVSAMLSNPSSQHNKPAAVAQPAAVPHQVPASTPTVTTSPQSAVTTPNTPGFGPHP